MNKYFIVSLSLKKYILNKNNKVLNFIFELINLFIL